MSYFLPRSITLIECHLCIGKGNLLNVTGVNDKNFGIKRIHGLTQNVGGHIGMFHSLRCWLKGTAFLCL